DLNKLWWDIVEKHQLLRRPPDRNAPDYGSKIHIIVAPVYYHNYMMGELFASQLHHAIAREVYGGAHPSTVTYAGNRAVGRFMQNRSLVRQYQSPPSRAMVRSLRGSTRPCPSRILSSTCSATISPITKLAAIAPLPIGTICSTRPSIFTGASARRGGFTF